MNSNKHLLTALFLYAITGVSACVLYTNSDLIPVSIKTSPPKSAALAPPMVVSEKSSNLDTQNETDTSTEVKLEEIIVSEDTNQNTDDSEKKAETESFDMSDTDSSQPEYTYTASHSTGRLFVRDGASLDNKIISFMKPGTTGDVISISDEWVFLKYNDIEGYVYKGYLNLTEKK